ncbi:hypothetical protein [Phenylobacterium sp.]|jgi:hypothetical protein
MNAWAINGSMTLAAAAWPLMAGLTVVFWSKARAAAAVPVRRS